MPTLGRNEAEKTEELAEVITRYRPLRGKESVAPPTIKPLLPLLSPISSSPWFIRVLLDRLLVTGLSTLCSSVVEIRGLSRRANEVLYCANPQLQVQEGHHCLSLAEPWVKSTTSLPLVKSNSEYYWTWSNDWNMEQGSTSASTSDSNGQKNYTLPPKHTIFMSHSGAQKGFVEQLCVDLERCNRHPFLDKWRGSLPIGKDFPSSIFQAIDQCEVGVVVLSEEFFTSKWPMLELVAMNNVKKRNPSFTIVPIFLGITLLQYLDRDNQSRWLSTWYGWAQRDSRIDREDWENALQMIHRTNSLKYNVELGEVKFREEIVEEICKLVPLETRLEDSHIQGRSRLCKLICEKIEQSGVSTLYGVRIVGIYGVGGIGKTTICKAMCNDLSEEYRGKVAHVELGSQSEHELWKEVLRRLIDTKLELLGSMNVDEYRYRMMRDMMHARVFLTIDNVSSATRDQALTLLRAKYAPGSVVLVTTRFLGDLTSLSINANECMEMPEIEVEEAKALFLYHVACVPPNEADNQLVSSCVRKCYFEKGNGMSSHYHPLALQALGGQLGCVGYDPERWWAILEGNDIFNPSRECQHPIFSILRRSFDALNIQDQLLFMDAALFIPHIEGRIWHSRGYKLNVYEWFGMVYGIRVNTVIERLENLKRKSLVENLGDGFSRIGMHDLWREFARFETKVGEFEKRRWMFEWDEHNVLEEAMVAMGGSWGNLRRMFFLDEGFMKLEEVDFDCFPNVTVLKLSRHDAIPLQLDLSGLKHLKSLELDLRIHVGQRSQPETWVGLVGLSSLSKLSFLRWRNVLSACIDEIGGLTKLQVLDLSGGARLPDLSSLVLLQVACFRGYNGVETITGLSSKHTSLRHLDLAGCHALQSCSGVSELAALEELGLRRCVKLKEVPDLQKLNRLRKLNVDGCCLLTTLPNLGSLVSLLELDACDCEALRSCLGVGELIALQELRLNRCYKLEEVPNLQKLTRLRTLDVAFCRLLTALPGLGDLVSLLKLDAAGCDALRSCPGLGELVALQELNLGHCSNLTELPNLQKLERLRTLEVHYCHSLSALPALGDLVSLQVLDAYECDALRSCPGVGELVALQELRLNGCSNLDEVPNLQKLVRLQILDVSGCSLLTALPGLEDLVSLQELHASECDRLVRLPDLRNLSNLRRLDVSYIGLIEALPGVDELLCLQDLDSLDCNSLIQLPDMRKLTNLESLLLDPDSPLQSAAGLNNLTLLRNLEVGFDGEQCLWPDLCKFTTLESLSIAGWEGQGLCSLANFESLESLTLVHCYGELAPPDLEGLTRLRSLEFRFCAFEDMSGLSNSTSVEYLSIEYCDELEVLPDLRKLVRLKSLAVTCCAELRDFCGVLGLSNLELLDAGGHPWIYENRGWDMGHLTGLRSLDVSDSGFADLQAVAGCAQLESLVCCRCPMQELPDLAQFPQLQNLDVRECVNLTQLTCTGPLNANFVCLDVEGCRSLRALPDLSNAWAMVWLNVANSGVVMSPELILRMRASRLG